MSNVSAQLFTCMNPACGRRSSVDLSTEGTKASERIYECEHCHTRHRAVQLPTASGDPAQFEVVGVCGVVA